MSCLTIKEIAAQAGVSVSTVSRVMNGTGNVNKEARDRVNEVLLQTRFKPNMLARSLKSKRTNSIGVVISDISDRYYSLLTKSLSDLLSEKEYSLVICCTNGSAENERKSYEFLSEKSVDGIVLNTCGGLDDEITELSSRVPIVMVNRRLTDTKAQNPPVIDFVGSDDVTGMRSLTKYLIDHGHRNIGLINGNMIVSTSRERFEGYRQALESIGMAIKPDTPLHYHEGFKQESGYLGMSYLMNLPEPPTAIISTNDSIALGVMNYAMEKKIEIPSKIAFATYGDIDNASLFAVRPTCMTLNPQIVGRSAINCLFERISNPTRPNCNIVFSTSLQEGNSV